MNKTLLILPLLLLGASCAIPVERAPSPAVPVATPGADGCMTENPEIWGLQKLPQTGAFGGLSGIDYDPASGRAILISDDRGEHGGTRIFIGPLVLGADHTVRFTPDTDRLLNIAGKPGFDGESVRFAYGGGIVWGSEGRLASGMLPGIHRLRAGAARGEDIALPAIVQPDLAGTHGPRDNLAFEGISRGEGESLWLGVEAPMIAEGALPTSTAGSLTAIVHMTPDNADYRAFAYPLSPIAHQLPGQNADNGMSELLALDARRLLVLERSGADQGGGHYHFTGRLFCAQPAGTATPDGRDLLSKQLIGDLTAMAAAKDIDLSHANFEGLSKGPRLPDGRESLILVSDNNFTGDPTVILVLSLQ